MQVESKAECSYVKLPFVIKIFVLSTSEWPLYTGFTVLLKLCITARLLHSFNKFEKIHRMDFQITLTLIKNKV